MGGYGTWDALAWRPDLWAAAVEEAGTTDRGRRRSGRHTALPGCCRTSQRRLL
ncbi:MAG: hypothetical protein AAFW98_16090 [Pseudomonadota bacterium]